MVTWLPVMSAGVAADVLCAVSYLASPWATAAPRFTEPLGFSKTTPVECLNVAIARSSTRAFGQLPFVNFAGNRRTLQDNAS